MENTIVEIARSYDGGYWLFGRGGSMVKLDPDWQHVWDTGWEPVGRGGLVRECGKGSYVMVGSLRSQLQVIRFRDRVPELPVWAIIPALLLGRLAFVKPGTRVQRRDIVDDFHCRAVPEIMP